MQKETELTFFLLKNTIRGDNCKIIYAETLIFLIVEKGTSVTGQRNNFF